MSMIVYSLLASKDGEELKKYVVAAMMSKEAQLGLRYEPSDITKENISDRLESYKTEIKDFYTTQDQLKKADYNIGKIVEFANSDKEITGSKADSLLTGDTDSVDRSCFW